MWRLGWRNLWRNRGRSLIAISAIAISLGLTFVTLGLMADRSTKMIDSAVRAAGGNLLVHAHGYWDAQTSDLVLDDPARVLDAIGELDGVVAVVPRVIINGLLTSARGAEGVTLTGIDPAAESRVEDYARFIVAGRFVEAGDDAEIVLGAQLVDRLRVELGDRVVLTATDVDGEVTRALFRLSGVIESGAAHIDGGFAFTSIAGAQRALAMGERLTQVAVLIDDDSRRHEQAAALRGSLTSGASSDAQPLEVLAWDDAIPDLLGFLAMDDAFGLIYLAVVFLVVAFGVANTLLMMVMERIRELGGLIAIGMTPRRVGTLVLVETAVLATVSVVIGLAIGLIGHAALARYGIDVAAAAGGDVELAGVSLHDTVIRSHIDPLTWVLATVAVVALVFLSALYPAWRAARLDPIEAMRSYR